MNAAETAARALVDGYCRAVKAKDVDAFCALYAENVHVFDTWGRWSYEGLADWRGMAEGWFGSLGDESVEVGVDDLRVHATDDMASITAYLTFTALSPSGEPQRALTNRLSAVARPVDGSWKIVHEHTSSPVDFQTGKLMLKR